MTLAKLSWADSAKEQDPNILGIYCSWYIVQYGGSACSTKFVAKTADSRSDLIAPCDVLDNDGNRIANWAGMFSKITPGSRRSVLADPLANPGLSATRTEFGPIPTRQWSGRLAGKR